MGIVRRQGDETEIDLLEVAKLLLSRWLIIVVVTLGFGLAAYGITYFFVTPLYQSYVTLYVNNSADNKGQQNISTSDLSASAKLVETYTVIITSRSVLEQVISKAGLDISVERMQKAVSAKGINSTEVFRVTVEYPDPVAAAQLANAIADIAPSKIADIVEGSSVKIVDWAKVPDTYSSPNYKRNMAIGALAGFVLTCAIIFLTALLNTAIRTEADFSQWEYPLLATIPDLMSSSGKKGYGYGKYGNTASMANATATATAGATATVMATEIKTAAM